MVNRVPETTNDAAPNDAAELNDVAAKKPSARLQLFPALEAVVLEWEAGFETILEDRKTALRKLASFVEAQRRSGQPARLTFICTHNSRRSHLSQLWAAVAAAYYGVDGVETYSGGTEATAFDPRAVAAMQRAGFRIEEPAGENPHYQVAFSDQAEAQECFSKKYDDPPNPKQHYAAVMTCSEADTSCPVVFGAALRISLPYVDPKESDGTPQETAVYDARSKQIGTEMLYLFSLVNTQS